MPEARLEIDIAADDAIKAIRQFAKTVSSSASQAGKAVAGIQDETKKTSNSFKDFASRARSSFSSVKDAVFSIKGALVGVAGIIAGRAVIGGLRSITEAASRQEDAVNNLNQALRSSGEFSAEASKGFQEFASSLQATTKFGDEVVLEQLALAKAFGATNEQAKEVTKAAIELAAATGKSLDEATRQVSKTLGGFAGELGEVNPAIKALTQEQLKAGQAAKILIAQYGGAAAAQLNTFSGATAQLSNTFGDLLEALGDLVIKNPVVIQSVKDLTLFVAELIKKVKDNSGEFEKFVRFISTQFIERATQIASIIGRLTILFGGLLISVKLVLAANALGGLAGVAIHLNSIAAALVLVAKRAAAFLALSAQFLVLAGAVAAIAVSVEVLVRNLGNLGNSIALTKLNKEIKELTTEIDKGRASLLGFAGAGRKLSDEELAKKQAELNEKLKEFNKLSAETDGFKKGTILEFIEKLKSDIENLGKDGGVEVEVTPKIDTGNITQGISSAQKEIEDKLKNINLISGAFDISLGLADDITEAFQNGGNILAKGISGIFTGEFKPFIDELSRSLDLDAINSVFQKPIDDLLGLDFGIFSVSIADVVEGLFKNFKVFGISLKDVFSFFIDNYKQVAEFTVNALNGEFIRNLITGISFIGDIPKQFIESFTKLGEITDNLVKELPEAISSLVNELPGIVQKIVSNLPKIVDSLVKAFPLIAQAIADSAPSIVTAILKGITKLIGVLPKIISTLAKAIGPILNAFLKELPAVITAIFDALPSIVESIVDAIPVILEKLADNIGPIVESFTLGIIDAAPKIVEALVRSLIVEGGAIRIGIAVIRGMINASLGLASAIAQGIFIALSSTAQFLGNLLGQGIKTVFMEFIPEAGRVFSRLFKEGLPSLEIPEPEWLRRFIDSIEGIGKNLDPTGGKLSGGNPGLARRAGEFLATGGISEARRFKLASGGVVPAGFPSDNFPASLTSGEEVVNVSDRTSILSGQNQILSLLSKMAGGGGGKTEVISTSVQLNNQAFANIILQLNRNNARLA